MTRNGKSKWFRQRASALMLADYDAARISFGLKGSAGVRPCMACLNVLKKNSGCVDPGDIFVDISEADSSKFIPTTDSGLFEAADQLKAAVTGGRSKEYITSLEKALGINFLEYGILYDTSARCRLLPTDFCSDGMHSYLGNGVASWEVGLFMAAIQKEKGWSCHTLEEASKRSCWKRPGASMNASQTFLKGLWYRSYFSESIYKGKADQVEALVPLLNYYACNLLGSSANLQDQLASYHLMAVCVAEMRRLKYYPKRLQPGDVDAFDVLQRQHQEAFVKAYDLFDVKHKHHHRRHLRDAFIKLGAAIRCEPLESKHRSYKGFLCDRLKNTVNVDSTFQKSMLSRMLTDHASRISENRLLPHKFTGPATPAADKWKLFCSDGQLDEVKCDWSIFIWKPKRFYDFNPSKRKQQQRQQQQFYDY